MFCECGTGSFKHVDEDPEDLVGSPEDKQERRKQHGGKVNPFAERGLDRFSVVLSELETRRAKILRRVVGASDAGLVLVRFVQSNNGDWTPVVVKLPEQPPPSKKAASTKKPARAVAAYSNAAPLRPPAPPEAPPRSSPPDPARPREGATAKVVATSKTKTNKVPARKASFSWERRMRRPSCYDWPSVIVLTLVSLAVFGRVFAICLASIWWYVLPTLGGSGEDADARRAPAGMRMSMEKKKVVSPPPPPNAKKGSISGVYQEVVRSPKGKRG